MNVVHEYIPFRTLLQRVDAIVPKNTLSELADRSGSRTEIFRGSRVRKCRGVNGCRSLESDPLGYSGLEFSSTRIRVKRLYSSSNVKAI